MRLFVGAVTAATIAPGCAAPTETPSETPSETPTAAPAPNPPAPDSLAPDSLAADGAEREITVIAPMRDIDPALRFAAGRMDPPIAILDATTERGDGGSHITRRYALIDALDRPGALTLRWPAPAPESAPESAPKSEPGADLWDAHSPEPITAVAAATLTHFGDPARERELLRALRRRLAELADRER
jgi:hypothetical protein